MGLDSAEFESGIKRVNRANQQLVRNTQVTANAVRSLTSALGIGSLGAAAKGYLSLSDQSAKLTAQLKLATAQSGSFAKAQEDVRRIASSTRTGIAETADLYATFQRNALELGITQEQAARSTETITKAFRISGATAAEAAGGLRQLLQGIQSGTLRGEELNSVLENAPRLAKALADGLGVTIGQLRDMGKEGELTGTKVIGALESAAQQIDREFAQLPVTFDESMTLVSNAAITTFGEFDRGGRFSTALANFVSDGSDGFAKLGKDAFDLGVDIRSTFAGLTDVFDPLVAAAKNAFGEIGDDAKTLADRIRPLLGEIDAITGWMASQESLPEIWINEKLWGRKAGGTSLQKTFDAGQKSAAVQLRREAGESQITTMLSGRDVMGNRIATSTPAASGNGSGGGKKGGGRGKSAETLRREAEREAKRAADALRQFTDTVGREEADLSEALAELSGDTSALADARMQQIEADRASRQRQIEADDSLDAAQRQQLINLNDDNASAQRRLVRKQELEDEMAKRDQVAMAGLDLEMELLSLSSDVARTAAEQRNVELRILDMAFERERLELEGIKARNAVTSAEWQIADARLQQLAALQSGARQQVIARTQGPLESFLDRLPRSADEAREALERVQVDGINGIIDGLADAATGARSLGDVFKNVTNQIIADLLRIQMQKAIAGGLSKALGGPFGGSAKLDLGALTSSTNSMIDANLANLPGFATGGSFKVGGMPGIDANIVSFKATRGEMVDIRKPGNDNRGRQTSVQVVPSPYFDVVVDGRVMQAAPAIANAGAQIGMAGNAQRATRRVG